MTRRSRSRTCRGDRRGARRGGPDEERAVLARAPDALRGPQEGRRRRARRRRLAVDAVDEHVSWRRRGRVAWALAPRSVRPSSPPGRRPGPLRSPMHVRRAVRPMAVGGSVRFSTHSARRGRPADPSLPRPRQPRRGRGEHARGPAREAGRGRRRGRAGARARAAARAGAGGAPSGPAAPQHALATAAGGSLATCAAA